MLATDSETPLLEVDLFLFSLVTLLAFTNAFIVNIFNPLLVFMGRQTSEERNLEQKRQVLLEEQAELNMVNQFARYSKVQRQINTIDTELDERRRSRSMNSLVKRIVVQHGLKVVFSLILFFISIYYRSVPVLTLDERYSLYPFGSVISYPNKKVNAVSVHMWVLCCTAFAQLLKNV